MIKIKRGLDVPISGSPVPNIVDGPKIRTVALVGSGYFGLRPTMEVEEGDVVKLGQVLFTDKKNPGVKFTSPASGKVAAINRGAKRVFQSVVIDVEGDEAIEFSPYSKEQLQSASREEIQSHMIDSGVWTMLRSRPYGKIPAPGSSPNSIFINAMDTNPLAADPVSVIVPAQADFKLGIECLAKLTDGKVFLCKAEDSQLGDLSDTAQGQLQTEDFTGPHPSGLAGTHIHYLDPVSENKVVWTINYQQVIALGRLLESGRLSTDRVVALGGPQVEDAKVVRTRLGASTDELCAGQLKAGNNRVIVGSILSGVKAEGAFKFLDDSANQISVISEDAPRELVLLMGHVSPHLNRHSVKNLFLSKLSRNKLFDFTSALNGGQRAMVPVGSYEEVMPLDILPTQLLRAILVGDTETAVALGGLELVEEDLALCTYVCPGKYEYGPVLRDTLTTVELDG